MIISPGRGYIFVHIPKTGGTSLALALEARAMADDILIGDTPKAIKRRGRVNKLNAPGRLWKHSRLADIEGMAGVPDPAFVFTLVRNPWDRLVSLYHWLREQSFSHPMIDAAKTLGFEDFLNADAVLSALRQDGATHYVTTRAGVLRCDAFIRLERLRDDLAPVEDHLGFKLDVPHVNTSDHPPAAQLCSHKTAAFIAEIFSEDIDRFGYSFPD